MKNQKTYLLIRNRNRTSRRSELIADQHLLGVSDITLTSNQSVGVANLPPTPVVVGAEEQQLLTPVVAPQPDMEATFIEHMLPPTDVEMLPFMRDEPQQVGDTPQEAPPANQPESAPRADVTMREEEDNVERMPNVFQEPENAAVTVSVTVGNISFVHALPTHELMEAEGARVVQPPADNIATRLRPRRRRRLAFEDYPISPSEPPRRRRKQKKRSQPRKDAPADVPLDAPHPPADAPLDAPHSPADVPLDAPHPPADVPLDAPHPPADVPLDAPHPPADAHFDDLGVMPLPEHDQQDGEPLFHTLENRKDDIIAELRELQMKHGNLISFVQICPTEITRRDRAAGVFAILLELCYERQIELIQEVPNAPDHLFIKMRFGEQV
ncbi:BRD4-interacting chromatin-remodeling complex-associated protein-like isoform X2 [Nilaparvata lugens]|uniref:BRD4-interacting chromatin-remodeling complex-associated protein-like isoform X2 n=1 Tax=Nilaparvata lugens TaxID=108931 RepID=UPI00193E02C3|nr:BRD4-interacting chromatin-remodeling complex-associated protein-like isoform X2 [Nilaparvata lugens]